MYIQVLFFRFSIIHDDVTYSPSPNLQNEHRNHNVILQVSLSSDTTQVYLDLITLLFKYNFSFHVNTISIRKVFSPQKCLDYSSDVIFQDFHPF